MKDIITQQLDGKDIENASILSKLGDMTPIEGKTLMALSICGKLDIQGLEAVCGARQPELSLATRALIARGYIKGDNEKLNGKGRPKAVFDLAVSFKKIVADIEKVLKATVIEDQKRIARLKELCK